MEIKQVGNGKKTDNNMKYFTKRWNLCKGKKRLNLLKNEIKSLYVNRELIAFMQNLTDMIKSKDDKQYYLLFCKKVILQTNRFPDSNHYEAFKEEYNQFFEETKEEQANYNPISWIDAELDFLKLEGRGKEDSSDNKNNINEPPQRTWMTFSETLDWLKTSKMALRRRITEGMPCIKLGNVYRFDPKEITSWLVTRN